MKKVYQRIDSPDYGDCFKCSICSLLELAFAMIGISIKLQEVE